VSTAAPPAADAPAATQNLTSAVLIANRLMKGLQTVRALPSRRATHQRPSIALVKRIHARARDERAHEPGIARGSPIGWTFLELKPQTTGVGSFWKVSHQSSGGYSFYLFEHYLCVRAWRYEGPSYVYVVLNDRLTYLGFLFGGKLITA
jgi:hypothetical protein